MRPYNEEHLSAWHYRYVYIYVMWYLSKAVSVILLQFSVLRELLRWQKHTMILKPSLVCLRRWVLSYNSLTNLSVKILFLFYITNVNYLVKDASSVDGKLLVHDSSHSQVWREFEISCKHGHKPIFLILWLSVISLWII